MEKKHSTFSNMWKRSLGMFAAGAIACSLLPGLSLSVSAGASDAPDLRKAGSIPASEETRTVGGPFERGTAGCERFRIPALITLQNGELLATADARYGVLDGTDAPDGGGLDSIASVSGDGGKTWNYSFPFYFPDCEGNDGRNATTIIDPSIVEGPDGTIYCFADVNPTGITTMYGTIRTGTGYVLVDGSPYLALTDKYANANTEPSDEDLTTYPYYVSDFDENGYAPILKREDGSPTGYGVDEWYNIYHVEDGEYVMGDLTQKQTNTDQDIQQNAYYKDSMFHVYNIGYIWVISSKDHGRTWEHPRNINYQVKRHSGENAILVSPGKGLTTEDGTIIMGFYNAHDGEENASFIYSHDNGKTWGRTADVPGAALGGTRSSEHEIVELEDGTLRMFFRRGDYLANVGPLAYVDAVRQEDGSYEFGEVQYSSANLQTGCNLTAISYSKKIDGRQLILVAGPSGKRVDGVILAFLVNDDAEKSMELIHTFYVPEGQGSYPSYVYSCLSELEDGSIGLVWEPNHYSIRYSRFDIHEVVPGRELEGGSVSFTKNIEVSRDAVYTEAYAGEGNIVTEPDAEIAVLELEKGTESTLTITGTGEGFTEAVVDGTVYRIRVTEEHAQADSGCTHVTELRTVIPATCMDEGYTGDEICTLCGGIVKEGETIPAFGHNWDEGTVTRAVTRTENGEIIYICKNDETHQKTEKIYASAYAVFMDAYEAAGIFMEDLGLYTEETAALLQQAYAAGKESAEGTAGRAAMYQDAADLQAAAGGLKKKSADTLKEELKKAAETAAADIGSQGGIPDSVWKEFKEAYENAQAAQLPSTEDELWALVKAMNRAQEKVNAAKKVLEQQALAAAKGELAAAVSSAKTLIDAGQGGYTSESWKDFAAAYDAAVNAPANTDAAALKKLTEALEQAKRGLKKAAVQIPGIQRGDTENAGNGCYQVLDAKKKTAALIKVLNKKAAKLVVPAEVEIKGVTCKVVQIGNKVLKGSTKVKKVILGKNVTTIGKQAFMNCKNLRTVQVQGSALKTIRSGAFKKTSAKITVSAKKMNKKQKAALLKKLKKAGISKKAKVK